MQVRNTLDILLKCAMLLCDAKWFAITGWVLTTSTLKKESLTAMSNSGAADPFQIFALSCAYTWLEASIAAQTGLLKQNLSKIYLLSLPATRSLATFFLKYLLFWIITLNKPAEKYTGIFWGREGGIEIEGSTSCYRLPPWDGFCISHLWNTQCRVYCTGCVMSIDKFCLYSLSEVP